MKPAERVEAAFESENEGYVEHYLETLHSVWKDVSLAIRRSVIFVLIAVVLFELLTRSAVAELSLGPIRLKDLSLAYKVLPVLAAYVSYETITLVTRWLEIELTYHETMEKYHPGVCRNDLDLFLYPSMLAGFSLSRQPLAYATPSLVRFRQLVGNTLAFVVFALPIMFQIYAYFQLFKRFGAVDLVLWIALVLSASFTIVYVLLVLLLVVSEGEGPSRAGRRES